MDRGDRAGLRQPRVGAQAGTRIAALDGLRGIAACVVVFHHVLLTVPSFAVAYQFTDPNWSHTWTDVLVFSPLHVIWDGPGAVVVFFVLSGFVLAAPSASGAEANWPSYYAQRLVRLYLPVWGALVFALITVAIVHRHTVPGATYFTNLHASTPHGIGQAIRNAPLLFKTGWLDSPLWSLRFEVAFSVLLPLALAWGRIWRRQWPAKLVTCVVVITVGGFMHSQLLIYAPMFALGTVLAYEREEIARLTSRLQRIDWWALVVWTVLLLSAYWNLWGVQLGAVAGIGMGLSGVGACALLVLVSEWPTARSFAESPVVQWLGKRSFSLYLVHEPIVLAVTFALGGRPDVFLTLAIALPLALTSAEVFFRVVERPSHRLARSLGRRVADAGAARQHGIPTVAPAIGPRPDRRQAP